jgi:hypothetical protein
MKVHNDSTNQRSITLSPLLMIVQEQRKRMKNLFSSRNISAINKRMIVSELIHNIAVVASSYLKLDASCSTIVCNVQGNDV